MKHTVLITVIILCLVVFVTSTAAGIVLTFTTVGWNELLDTDRIGLHSEQIADQIRNWSQNIHIGPLNTYSIDETKTDSLDGIDTIIITGVTESITVNEEGTQFSGRLHGSYRSGSKLVWKMNKNGSTLQVKIDYPHWGFRATDLAIQVQVPKSYTGKIEIHSVSGNAAIVNSRDARWSEVGFTSVSGSVTANTATWPKSDMNSVSGEIRLAELLGKAIVKTVSGRVDLSVSSTKPENIRIDTVSGLVKMTFPLAAEFNIEFDSVSGSFDSSQLPFEVTKTVKRRIEAERNGGGNLVSVKTVSGDLKLFPAA